MSGPSWQRYIAPAPCCGAEAQWVATNHAVPGERCRPDGVQVTYRITGCGCADNPAEPEPDTEPAAEQAGRAESRASWPSMVPSLGFLLRRAMERRAA